MKVTIMENTRISRIWYGIQVLSSNALSSHSCIPVFVQNNQPAANVEELLWSNDICSSRPILMAIVIFNHKDKEQSLIYSRDSEFQLNDKRLSDREVWYCHREIPSLYIPLLLSSSESISSITEKELITNSELITLCKNQDEINPEGTLFPKAILVSKWIKQFLGVSTVDIIIVEYGNTKSEKSRNDDFLLLQAVRCSILSIQCLNLPKELLSVTSSIGLHHPIVNSVSSIDSYQFNYRSVRYRSLLVRILSYPELPSAVFNTLRQFPFFPNRSIVSIKLGSYHFPFIIQSNNNIENNKNIPFSLIQLQDNIDPTILIIPNYFVTPPIVPIPKHFLPELPPHINEYLSTILKNLFPSPPSTLSVIHSALLENMTFNDQILFLKSLITHSHSRIQIHRCPLSVHLSDSFLYKKIFCMRCDSGGPSLPLSFSRLGFFNPKTLSGELLLSYCKQPIRWNVGIQRDKRNDIQNDSIKGDLIVLVLDDINHLTWIEWEEVSCIIKALINELIEIISLKPHSYVSLLLLSFWYPLSLSNQPSVPNTVREFFNRRWNDINHSDSEFYSTVRLQSVKNENRKSNGLPMNAQVAAWRRKQTLQAIEQQTANNDLMNRSDIPLELKSLIESTSNEIGFQQLQRFELTYKVLMNAEKYHELKNRNYEVSSLLSSPILPLLPDLYSRMISQNKPSELKKEGVDDEKNYSASMISDLSINSFMKYKIEAIKDLDFSIFKVLENPVCLNFTYNSSRQIH